MSFNIFVMAIKINIITIGSFRSKDEYLFLFNEYKKRLPWNINLIELKNSKSDNVSERIEKESAELLKNITVGHKLIVLDERGDIITTNKFESICSKYFETSAGIDFVIGGSDGLSQRVRDRANFVLSLGKMVFPHLMVRVMLLEQLYRVYALRTGRPYHK
ncbi:MAG: 23S rRNA (pseudouridine(1915)-N(3))-methyltransferase RlmH [Rickettsiales bacterium]|nr:23S rRNA (pseudouridine(1915)-N(3))-methyltransferase RlmH [Rickettsiales bacterium]